MKPIQTEQAKEALNKGLNEIAHLVHENAVSKGFWEEIDYQRTLSLISGELSGEGVEARRTSRFSDYASYENEDSGFIEAFEKYIKNTWQDEVADAYIRILDLCGHLDVNVEDRSAIEGTITKTDDIYGTINLITYYISRVARHHTLKGNMYETVVALELVKSLVTLEDLAEMSGINLGWHITNKIAYNSMREYKHGKQF